MAKRKSPAVKKKESVPKKVVEKKEKKYTYNIFNFVDKIFTAPEEAKKASKIEKRSYSFMLNRFCAINFPVVSFSLSRNGISDIEKVNYWITILSRKYKYKPKWFNAIWQTKQKEKAETNKEWKPEAETVAKYCQTYKLDSKTYQETLKFYKDDFLSELKTFEKMMKGKDK
jgi:hypothetical protein